MERYILFIDQKNQYCENDYTTQGNLQIHVIPIKLPRAFFHRISTTITKKAFDK